MYKYLILLKIIQNSGEKHPWQLKWRCPEALWEPLRAILAAEATTTTSKALKRAHRGPEQPSGRINPMDESHFAFLWTKVILWIEAILILWIEVILNFYGSRSFYGSTSFSMDEGHFAFLWTKVILLNAHPDSPARRRSGYSLRLMVVNFC